MQKHYKLYKDFQCATARDALSSSHPLAEVDPGKRNIRPVDRVS